MEHVNSQRPRRQLPGRSWESDWESAQIHSRSATSAPSSSGRYVIENRKSCRAASARAISSEYGAQPDENDSEAGGDGAVRGTCQTDNRREDADRPERGGVQKCLPAGPAAVRFNDGQQWNAGARVVVLVHPRDGEEVRHLPEEDDAEEHDRGQRDAARRGRPSDDWRQRTGHRTDECRERRACLQRRVHEHVTAQRQRPRRPQPRASRPERQFHESDCREQATKPRAFCDAEAAARQAAARSCGACACPSRVPRPDSAPRRRQPRAPSR